MSAKITAASRPQVYAAAQSPRGGHMIRKVFVSVIVGMLAFALATPAEATKRSVVIDQKPPKVTVVVHNEAQLSAGGGQAAWWRSGTFIQAWQPSRGFAQLAGLEDGERFTVDSEAQGLESGVYRMFDGSTYRTDAVLVVLATKPGDRIYRWAKLLPRPGEYR